MPILSNFPATDSTKMDKVNPTGTGSISLNNYRSLPTGDYSVAVGYDCEASGSYSTAEGYSTRASGQASHAEGYGTTADSPFQHAQGKYNVPDAENKYAHIVGNGSADIPSNGHTLDWDGNAWFAGDVYLGGTGQDDGDSVSLTDSIAGLQDSIGSHTHTASEVGADVSGAADQALADAKAYTDQKILYGTDDLIEGESALETGTLYCFYE